MKKLLLSLLVCAGALSAQVTFTPDAPATGATPGNLVMVDSTAGGPALSCTVTPNAVPATAVTTVCTVNGNQVENDKSTPAPGEAVIISINSGSNSLIAELISCLPVSGATAPAACGTATAGIAVQAASHAATPVTQGTW
jgi:hypothetical protein